MGKRKTKWLLKQLQKQNENVFNNDTVEIHNKIYKKSSLEDQLGIIETALRNNCMLDESCIGNYVNTLRQVERILKSKDNNLLDVNISLPQEKIGCLCLECNTGVYNYSLCTFLPDNKWFYTLNKDTGEWERHDNVVRWIGLPPIQDVN